MNGGLDVHEEGIWQRQYPDCDGLLEKGDLVFAYPSQVMKEADIVADKLQSATAYLKYVTDLDPTPAFGSRVVIGFRHETSQPNWSGKDGNRIHIPWEYLFKENKTLFASSHELVHPFYNLSPLHASNERWGDCFCVGLF